MKTRRLAPLFFGLTLALCTVASQTHALPVLPFPTADDLTGPVFVQPFAGLAVVSESAGIGRTGSFFSDLPDGAFQGDRVLNILGNFQAFDLFGAPTSFDIVGVEVTDLGSTITPAFGEFDFAGHPSLTFSDSVDFDAVTFFAGDFTLAFTFGSDPALDYSFEVLTTGLPVGSFILFDDVETSLIPEPATFALFGLGLGLLALARNCKRVGAP